MTNLALRIISLTSGPKGISISFPHIPLLSCDIRSRQKLLKQSLPITRHLPVPILEHGSVNNECPMKVSPKTEVEHWPRWLREVICYRTKMGFFGSKKSTHIGSGIWWVITRERCTKCSSHPSREQERLWPGSSPGIRSARLFDHRLIKLEKLQELLWIFSFLLPHEYYKVLLAGKGQLKHQNIYICIYLFSFPLWTRW